MSLDLLEQGAGALGPLLGEVVFVGGATMVLWVTDPAASSPRPTLDVDVIVEVAADLVMNSSPRPCVLGASQRTQKAA